MNPNLFIVLGGVLGGLQDSLRESAEGIFQGAIQTFLKLANFGNIFNKDYGIMPTLTITEKGEFIFNKGLISPLIQGGASFGAVFALIFMVIAMVDIYTQEKMTVETFAKPFIQYLITVAFLLNAEKLIAVLWNFGVLFQNRMSVIANSTVLADMVTVELSGTCSLGALFGFIIGGFILLIICLLGGLIIRVCAYIANFSRIIEAAIRGVGVPIALGISAETSLRSGAIRYLKKFLAVALQGGIFIAISFIFSAISTNVLATSITDVANIDDKVIAEMTADMEHAFKWDEERNMYILTELAGLSAAERSNVIADSKDFINGNTLEGMTSGTPSTFSYEGDKTIGQETLGKLSLIFASAAVLPISLGDTLASSLLVILYAVIPLFGVGLASVAVLFKSGQICNDIVGA